MDEDLNARSDELCIDAKGSHDDAQSPLAERDYKTMMLQARANKNEEHESDFLMIANIQDQSFEILD